MMCAITYEALNQKNFFWYDDTSELYPGKVWVSMSFGQCHTVENATWA